MSRPKKQRDVTEADFRLPEFREAKPEDYEFSGDGSLVRKDRWEQAIRKLVSRLGMGDRQFEISDVLEAVKRLQDATPGKGSHIFIRPNIVVWSPAVKMSVQNLRRLPRSVDGRELVTIVVVPDETMVRGNVQPIINKSASADHFAEFEHFRFTVADRVDTSFDK